MLRRIFYLPLVISLTCLSLILFIPIHVMAMGSSQQKEEPDAVILLWEKEYQVDRDGSYTLKAHIKTHVNTYQGKKAWADFKTRYNQQFENIKILEAHTTTPQGKVINVTPKEIHDISDPSTQSASLFSSSRLKVVNFPSVEEGCTVEIVLEKKSSLGFWTIEPFSIEDPIKKKVIKVTMPSTMNLSIHMESKEINHSEEVQGDKKVYLWIGINRSRILSEPMMPPVENRDDTLIISTLHSWQDVSKLFTKLLAKRVNRPQKATDVALTALAGSSKDPDSIFATLKEHFEVFPVGIFRSNLAFSSPTQTARRGYGSQMDMIILFTHLLNLNGIENQTIAVNSSNVWLDDIMDCYNPALFNTFLVKAGNKFYSFDIKEAAPGVTGFDSAKGLDLKSATFITIKDSVKNEGNQVLKIDFKTPASFKTDYLGKFKGLKSVSLKANFKDLTPSEFKVKQSIYYHSLHPLAQPLDTLLVDGLEQLSSQVTVKGSYKVENFSLENHSRFFFPVQVPGVLINFSTLLPNRNSDIYIRTPLVQNLRLEASLPQDLSIKYISPTTSGSIGPFSWESSCSLSNKKVVCNKTVRLKRGFIKRGKEYQTLRKVVQNLIDPVTNTVTMKLIKAE